MSFSYSGDATGSFSAVGDYPEPPPVNGSIFAEWAKSERIERIIDLFHKEDWISISANFPPSQSTNASNITLLRLPDKGTGTYPLVNGWEVTEVNLNGQPFAFTGGAINVTYYNKGRIRGTFEGSAKSYGSPDRYIQLQMGSST